MSAPLSIAQARAIADGLYKAADVAEAKGETTFDLTQASFDALDVSIDEAQAAVDAVRAQQGKSGS